MFLKIDFNKKTQNESSLNKCLKNTLEVMFEELNRKVFPAFCKKIKSENENNIIKS